MASPSRSGVFQAETDSRLEAYAESISFDSRLYEHDIRGSIAHANMLRDVDLLTDEEFKLIKDTLETIRGELDRGELPMRFELEDIHMHVEQALIDRIGDTGRKLHTARSRNDQVSTDTRMWIRQSLDEIDALLVDLQAAFLSRCENDFDVVLPAYTHLQRAQPVLAPHYWLAYIEKLERDRQRIADCRKRVNQCSLGIAAVAGTTLPIDRQHTASALDFEGITANSLDTSSDRDFVVEFDFIQIPQAFCTGSSIMPQKVNPDTLELTRGKSARVMGALQTLMLLIKNLPLAYNRDLQEDKPPLFDAFDTTRAMLELAAPIVRGAELKRESISARIEKGYLDATTLMEWMIARGMPQRTAHHLVGAIVSEAMQQGVTLSDLPLATYQKLSDQIDESVYEVLGTANAIAAFRSEGSTAPARVREQIKLWTSRLENA